MTAKKDKKQLTTVQKYVKARNLKYTFLGAKWMSIITPYIVIGAVNFEEYFTEVNGLKMSFGCMLACLVAGIAIFNETKKQENKQINGIMGWAIALALAWLFSSILNDLVMILAWGLVGQIIGAGWQLAADNEKLKATNLKQLAYEVDSEREKARIRKEVYGESEL